MTKGISPVTRRFEGVLKENAERITFNIGKSEQGVLNSVRVNTEKMGQEKPVYNYAFKKGLDVEYFKEVMTDFCQQVKDGSRLLKEIFEYGLNLKK